MIFIVVRETSIWFCDLYPIVMTNSDRSLPAQKNKMNLLCLFTVKTTDTDKIVYFHLECLSDPFFIRKQRKIKNVLILKIKVKKKLCGWTIALSIDWDIRSENCFNFEVLNLSSFLDP